MEQDVRFFYVNAFVEKKFNIREIVGRVFKWDKPTKNPLARASYVFVLLSLLLRPEQIIYTVIYIRTHPNTQIKRAAIVPVFIMPFLILLNSR